MSALDQKRTQPSLNHFIGKRVKLGRNVDAKSRCSLQVDDQFKSRWLHNRQLRRIGTLENTSSVDPCLTIRVCDIGAVAQKAASRCIVPKGINGRCFELRCPSDNLHTLIEKERIGAHQERVW